MEKLTKKEMDLIELLNSDKCQNYYTGNKRWTRKSADYAGNAAILLKKLGFKIIEEFITGNDAPRGGWSGRYCKLTENGKKNPIILECLQNLSIICKKKQAKLLAQNKTKWQENLKDCCQKRLVCESKNGKRKLNRQIRFYAYNLGIDLSIIDFNEFVQKTA
jgi:hypothetical protein